MVVVLLVTTVQEYPYARNVAVGVYVNIVRKDDDAQSVILLTILL